MSGVEVEPPPVDASVVTLSVADEVVSAVGVALSVAWITYWYVVDGVSPALVNDVLVVVPTDVPFRITS
jgi:hypothetical protein